MDGIEASRDLTPQPVHTPYRNLRGARRPNGWRSVLQVEAGSGGLATPGLEGVLSWLVSLLGRLFPLRSSQRHGPRPLARRGLAGKGVAARPSLSAPTVRPWRYAEVLVPWRVSHPRLSMMCSVRGGRSARMWSSSCCGWIRVRGGDVRLPGGVRGLRGQRRGRAAGSLRRGRRGRDSFERGSAAAVVSWRQTCPQPMQRYRRSVISSTVGRHPNGS